MSESPKKDAPNYFGIEKKILHGAPGTGNVDVVSYPKETKFTFHYQIRTCDEEHKVLDDTRKYGKTMELYSGKKFQLDVWELCLESMAVSEVASFTVQTQHLGAFAVVNKKLRDYMLNKHEHGHAKHCCGMMSLQEQGGLGYPDLDKFLENPQPLEFIFELIKVERPDEVRKESWIMNEEEKDKAVPQLREEGNELFRAGDFKTAALRYREALSMLEQLVLREKPGDVEWLALEKRKVPFLLNLAQCEISMQEYYPAITHLSDALEKEPDNVKALYRRGKAHRAVWNLNEAEADFQKAAELDPSLVISVNKEMQVVEKLRKEKIESDRNIYKGKLFA